MTPLIISACSQSSSSEVLGFFCSSFMPRNTQRPSSCLLAELAVDIPVVDADDFFHLACIREFDVMENTAAQESIRQFFFRIGRDDYE